MADLPLESIAWHAEVTGTVATVTVDHTFRNDTDRVIEGTYVFPLAGDATLDRVHIDVGTRALESQVVDRGVAWSMWDTAKKHRKIIPIPEDAKPYRYRQYLTDIRPGESVHVVLEAAQSVARHDGAWELALPVAARPRFIQAVPSGEPQPPASPQPPVSLALDLDVHAAVPILRAESPTHPLTLAINGAELQASTDDAARDLVLRWWTATDTPQAGLLVNGEHGLLTVEAPPTQAGRMPREVMWVVDTTNLPLAKEAMARSLDGMNPGDSVALLTYAPLGGVTVRPHAATLAYVRRLRRRIDRLKDGVGSEGPALLAALRWPADPARHRMICLLTDGRDQRADEVLAELSRHPEVTVSVVNVGGRLDALAVQSGGVTLQMGAGAEGVAAALEPPALSELRVDWGGWQVVSTSPPKLADVQAGNASTLSVHLAGGSGPVTIHGRTANGAFIQEILPQPIDDGRGLEVSWARAQIADLLARYGPYVRNQSSVDTALRWGIETDYTPRILAPVDAESADLLAREFLELRIPVSRSGGHDRPGEYSYIPNLSIPGPVGGELDPLRQLPRSLGAPEPETGFSGPLVFRPADISVGGTGVATRVRLDPAWTFGGDDARAVLDGTLGMAGPLGMRNLRIAGLASGRYFLGLPVVAEEAGVSLRYHPLSLYDFSAAARATRVVAEGSRVYTDAAAGLTLHSPFNRKPRFLAWLSAADTSAYGDSRSVVEGGGELRQTFKWHGDQTLYTQARVMGLGWEAAPEPVQVEQGSALLVTTLVGDDWSAKRFGLSARLGVGLLATEVKQVVLPPSFLPAPAMRLWWNVTKRGEQAELAAAYEWDTEGLRIGALDEAGRPGRTGYAALTARSRGFSGFQAGLGLRFESRLAPLVPRIDHTTVNEAADAPWFNRQSLSAHARLSWQVEPVEASVTWRYAFDPWDDAPLLDDPRAAWVPGYLEPWRANVVHALLAFKPRVEPSLLAFAVSGAWAQAIEPESEHGWLQDQLSVTGSVKGGVQLRGRHAGLQLDVSWSRRDPSLALLPPIVLVRDADETLDTQAPWRVGARLEAEF